MRISSFRSLALRKASLAIAIMVAGLVAMSTAAIAAPTYVIEISVDGLGSSYLQTLLGTPSQVSNFNKLVTEGAYTFNARDDYDYTETLQNHISMVTGRGVWEGNTGTSTTGHGWTVNGEVSGQNLHTNPATGNRYIASVFDVVHDNGGRTGMYATKSKFNLFDYSYDGTNGALDTTGPDNGRDKIDNFANSSSPAVLSSFLSDMAANPMKYSFVHFSEPDSAGHASGWGSTAYMDSVRTVDGYLGQIFNLINTDSRFTNNTAVILTADHGGTGTGHGDASLAIDYTIPFMVWGGGATAGAELYSMNTTTRLEPGVSRPLYSGTQPIRNADGANLALDLLGYGPIPNSTVNFAQNLTVASGTPPVTIAHSNFAEPAAGSTNYVPASGATELGFTTTSTNQGTGSTIGVTSSPDFLMKSVLATATFSQVNLANYDQVAFSMNMQVSNTTWEADDYFRAVLSNGVDSIDLVRLEGTTPLQAAIASGYTSYSVTIPDSWNQATLTVSSSSNSGSALEFFNFDNLLFTGVLTVPMRELTWNTTNGTWNTTSTNKPWTESAAPTSFQATDNVTFNQTAGGTVTVDAAGVAPTTTTVSAASGTYTFAGGPISGALNKSGGGTMVLQAPNSFASTSITGGTVETPVAGALGSGPVTLDGGKWKATATQAPANAVGIGPNGGTIEVAPASTLTLGDAGKGINGTGSLTKTGDGVLTLTAASTYSGATNIEQGVVRIGMPSGGVVAGAIAWLDASTLSLNNGDAVTSVVNQGTLGGTFIVNSDTPTFNAAGLNGMGTINLNGADGLKTSVDLGFSGNANNVSVFSVMRRSTADGTANIQLGSGTANYSMLAISSNPNGLWCPSTYGTGAASTGVQPADTFQLLDFVHKHGTPTSTAGTHWGYINGACFGSGSNDGDVSVEAGPLYIGTAPITTAVNSDVAEVLVYNTALTDAERKQVEAYLSYKWLGINPNANLLPTGTALNISSGATLDLNSASQTVGSLSGQGTVLLGNGNLTVNSTADSTFAGTISGNGGLVKSGANKLTLTGTSSFTGPITVSGGTLQGNLATLPTAISLSSNGNVTFDLAADTTYALPITGAGSMTKLGNNKMTLTGANTYTGTTTVDGGTLQGSLANIPGAVALANNSSVIFDQATDASLAQPVSGSGSLTKTGAGTMTVDANVSYTGDTVIEQGTLKLGSLAPASPTAGAALWLDAANSTTVRNASGAPAVVGEGVAAWVNPLVTDGSVKQGTDANRPIYGTHTINGLPVLYFDGANDSLTSGGSAYGNTGGLVTAFVVQRRTADAANYGRSVSFGDGTGDYGSASNWCVDNGGNGTTFYVERTSGHGQGSLPVVNTTYMTEVVFDGTNCTSYLNGVQAGSSFASTGNFNISRTVVGAGWDGSAENWRFTGDIAEVLVYNSVLTPEERLATEAYLNGKWLGGMTGLPSTTAMSINAGASFDMNNAPQTLAGLSGQGNVLLGTGTLTVNNTADAVFSGAISGDGALVKSGPNKLTLNGTSSYHGPTTVSGGTLEGSTSSLPTAITMSNNANVTFDQASNGVFAATIGGGGSLTKTGDGKLTLASANSYTGLTAVNGGTLEGSVAAIPTAVSLANNANVTYNQPSDVTLALPVTGTGSMTKSGDGVLTIKAVSSYSGDTTINGGTLRLAPTELSMPSGTTLWLDASTLSLNNGDAVATLGDLSGNNHNATAGNYGKNGSVTFNAAQLNGKGTIHFDDFGNLTTDNLGITGDADRSVFVVMRHNTGTYNRMSFTTGVPWNNTFGVDAASNITNFVRWNDGPDIDMGARASDTFEIYGMTHNGETHDSIVYASGSVIGIVTSPLATTDGPAIVGSFTPEFGFCHENGDFAEALVYDRLLSDAERAQVETYLNAKWFGIQPPTSDLLPTNTALTIAASSAFDLAGLNQTIGSLAGAGEVTLGTGTLTVASTADSAFSGSISGDGALVKTGDSTLTLSGANSYQGGTIVNAGVLAIDSADALSSGQDLIVGENGTVVLSSSIGKAVKIRRLTMLVGSQASGLSAAASASAPVAPVPEPSTLVLLAAGALALAIAGMRRRKIGRNS